MAINPADITDLDPLIHQQTRLLILTTLYPLERADFLYLLRETALTKGNLSTHAAKLEKAGYLHIEKTYRGRTPHTIYTLTEVGRSAFDRYREQLRALVNNLPDEGVSSAGSDGKRQLI